MNRARAAWVAWLGSVVVLAGCSGGSPGTDDPEPVATGDAAQSREFFGWQMQPCTQLELDGYPTNIARASGDYYQGPWCAREGSTRIYLWAYAREMTEELAPDEVRRDVTLDAEQLTLDLAAQGYLRVCGQVVGGGPVDVALEEPGKPLQIRVAALGQTPLSADDDAEQPLALVVAVSPATGEPAFAPELAAPPCAPLGTAEVTATSVETGLPSPEPTAQ